MDLLKRPSTTGGVVYLTVVAVVGTGVVMAALGAWRAGTVVMASGFAFACLMRAVLPEQRAGMLRVRSRTVDLLTLGVCSGLLLVLALLVPDYTPR